MRSNTESQTDRAVVAAATLQVCRKSGGERISSENPNSLACSERPNCAEQRLPVTQFECPSRFCYMLQRTLLCEAKKECLGAMSPDKAYQYPDSYRMIRD